MKKATIALLALFASGPSADVADAQAGLHHWITIAEGDQDGVPLTRDKCHEVCVGLFDQQMCDLNQADTLVRWVPGDERCELGCRGDLASHQGVRSPGAGWAILNTSYPDLSGREFFSILPAGAAAPFPGVVGVFFDARFGGGNYGNRRDMCVQTQGDTTTFTLVGRPTRRLYAPGRGTISIYGRWGGGNSMSVRATIDDVNAPNGQPVGTGTFNVSFQDPNRVSGQGFTFEFGNR